MTVPVYEEFPKRIAKMWKDEEERVKREARRAAGDVDMEGDHGDQGKDIKKHRDLFTKNNGIQNVFFNYGLSSDDDDSDSSDDESSDDDGRKMEVSVMISQNYFQSNS